MNRPRRIRRELKTVRAMIEIYCQRHHTARGRLCEDCHALGDYAQQRIERCPFGRGKPTCLNCTVHCFEKQKRDQIRTVMRYAGPRMPLRHPVLTVFHFLDGKRQTPRKTEGDSSRG